MQTYSQPELYQALTNYVKQEAALIAKAKAAVVEWKYAKEEMFGLFPLQNVIGFRGSSKWTPAKRRWLNGKHSSFCYQHGFDADGNIRIIERTNGMATLFISLGEVIDEVVIGGRGTSLKRHILVGERVVAFYHYHLDPHQYSREVFEFSGDRMVESVEESWFVSDGVWHYATWKTTCTYEYDEKGLLRVYRDSGEGLGGKQLVYVRSKSGILKKAPRRRPIVAYTSKADIQSDAYGLEMNIDDEWPIDTIILVPPAAISEVTVNTGVTTMGSVYAGASSTPDIGELKKFKLAGGVWVLIEAQDRGAATSLAAALKVGLNVLLAVADSVEVRSAIVDCKAVNPARLAIAYRPGVSYSPDAVQAVAAMIRAELERKAASASRIVVAAAIGKDQIMEYMAKPDIDGVLNENGDFTWAMEVLVPIALNAG